MSTVFALNGAVHDVIWNSQFWRTIEWHIDSEYGTRVLTSTDCCWYISSIMCAEVPWPHRAEVRGHVSAGHTATSIVCCLHSPRAPRMKRHDTSVRRALRLRVCITDTHRWCYLSDVVIALSTGFNSISKLIQPSPWANFLNTPNINLKLHYFAVGQLLIEGCGWHYCN